MGKHKHQPPKPSGRERTLRKEKKKSFRSWVTFIIVISAIIAALVYEIFSQTLHKDAAGTVVLAIICASCTAVLVLTVRSGLGGKYYIKAKSGKYAATSSSAGATAGIEVGGGISIVDSSGGSGAGSGCGCGCGCVGVCSCGSCGGGSGC